MPPTTRRIAGSASAKGMRLSIWCNSDQLLGLEDTGCQDKTSRCLAMGIPPLAGNLHPRAQPIAKGLASHGDAARDPNLRCRHSRWYLLEKATAGRYKEIGRPVWKAGTGCWLRRSRPLGRY